MNKRQIKKFKKRGGVKKYSTAMENELMFAYYLIGSRRRACICSVNNPLDESQNKNVWK